MKASTAKAISVAIAVVAAAAVIKTTIAVLGITSLVTRATKRLAIPKVTKAAILPLKVPANAATKVAAVDAGVGVADVVVIATIAAARNPKASKAAERFDRLF